MEQTRRTTVPRLGRMLSRLEAGLRAKAKQADLPIADICLSPHRSGIWSEQVATLTLMVYILETPGHMYMMQYPLIWCGGDWVQDGALWQGLREGCYKEEV